MNEKNLKKLKRTVYAMIVLFIITFWTGFLQDTDFGFVIYIFYFILLVGGVKLIAMTFQLKATGMSRVFLLLTGCSLTIYFVAFIKAVIGNLLSDQGFIEQLEQLEGILYLDSLLLIIGVIGSLISLSLKGARH